MKLILPPDVHSWSRHDQARGIDFNGWYISGGDGPVVIDPPPAEEEVFRAIESMGAPRAILLTNRDHVRDADRFAGRFRAPVLIHQDDAQDLAIRIGGVFRHGDDLPGGFRAIRVTDAKSPGECALLLRRAGALFLGDALIGKPAGELNLLPPEKIPDKAAAREGIRALLQYPFEAVLVGDGASFPAGGRQALESFLARSGR